jgi:lipopolysaccharide biosynthesis glycosyltransferase
MVWPKQMTSHIPIVYCFDASFSSYAAVSMTSLLTNSKSVLKIYCMVPSLDADNLPAIYQVADRFDADLAIVGVDISVFADWKQVHHFTHAVYLRLLIPSVVEETRAIYLDSDVLVLQDLSELYATPMGDCHLAGAVDPVGASTSNVPRPPDDVYINSGVLVMNLDGLRQDGFLKKCQNIYCEFHESITWPDQCLINKYAENKKVILDSKWNRQVLPNTVKCDEWNDLLAGGRTAIVHFVGGVKPWMEWCNPVIAGFWWGFAGRAEIHDLEPVRMSTIAQALTLAHVLDLNGDLRQAGDLKNRIIKSLLAQRSRQRLHHAGS